MKRYRVCVFDFDSRVGHLTTEIREEWSEDVKALLRQNRVATKVDLVSDFGETACDQKIRDFTDLGYKPFSILAFHNRFFEQIRTAFTAGAYYPALTAACALGERILNHMVLLLREDHRGMPGYKRVHRKDSFDDWDLPIDTLLSWGVLTTKAAAQFRELKTRRHQAIHFRPDVDRNDRDLALGAIRCLQSVIEEQFGAFGPQEWFLTGVPGEIYIKQEWETRPFVRRVYVPNCSLVGPRHRMEATGRGGLRIVDRASYEEREVSDEEFGALRRAFNEAGQPRES